MAVLGPNFPKCPICNKDMESVSLDKVPQSTRKEMARYNRYQPLNPNYWYKCEDDELILHKMAVSGK